MDEMDEDKELIIDKKSKKYIRYAKFGIVIIIVGLLISLIVLPLSAGTEGYWNTILLSQEEFILIFIGVMVSLVGVMTLSLALLSLALYSKNIHIYIRASLILALGLILGTTITAIYGLIGSYT
jgi:hypothetical protein